MKNIFFILVAIFSVVSCQNNEGESKESLTEQQIEQPIKKIDLTSVAFEHQEYDFGSIQQGEIVSYTFTYTNSGENDLVVYTVETDCGCTVPKYGTKPLKPNEKGEIEVQFNSSGYRGNQIKKVRMYINSEPSEYELRIFSFVETQE